MRRWRKLRPFDRVIVASGALEIDGYSPKNDTGHHGTGHGRSIRRERNWPCFDFETHQTIMPATCARGGCGFVGACWIHRGQ